MRMKLVNKIASWRIRGDDRSGCKFLLLIGNKEDAEEVYVSSFKARVIRTTANPTMSQIMRSGELQKKWGPAIREFIDDGLDRGMQKFISDEEVKVGGYKFIPHVSVFNTKRDGTLKYRLAPDGGKEPISDFEPGSLSSSGIDSPSFNFLMAYGAHNMAASFSDVNRHILGTTGGMMRRAKIPGEYTQG